MKMKRSEFDKILNEYIQREQDSINEHNEIREILLPLVGKPINGRTLNAKVLGRFTFIVEYGSLCYIKGNETHLIGYSNNENIIAVEKTEFSRGFDYFDNCSGGAAKERIEQIQNIDKDKAFKLFNEIDKTFNKMRTLFGDIERQKLGSYHFPCYYDILNKIYKGEQSTDIRITDFYFIRK